MKVDGYQSESMNAFGSQGKLSPVVTLPYVIIRYKTGHKFKPHRDGGFLLSNDVRRYPVSPQLFNHLMPPFSVFTVMIYLNTEFEGGVTHFMFQNEKKVLTKEFTYTPRTGNLLAFNHDVW